MRTFFVFFCSLLFTLCFLLNMADAEDRNVEIAVLLSGMSNPYWRIVEEGAAAKAKELGINAYIQGVQSESDVEGQLNVCETMLLRKPKALIFTPINTVNLTPCLQKASRLGIELINVDGGISKEYADKAGIRLLFSVASNNYELGRKGAEYLAGLKGKVLIIEGLPGHFNAQQRKKGFVENLSGNLEVVASLPGDWDRLKAADITNATVTRHPDLAAIFAANDLMALGAAEALRSRGLARAVTVVGIDGIADAIKAIKSERLTASIAQLPYLIGAEAVEKAHNHLYKKQEYSFDQHVPIITLDRDVLQKNEEPLLKFVK